VKHRIIGSIAAGLVLLLINTLAWAEARAFFDRDMVYQGETAILTIETDYPADGHSPDLGELTRDFAILETRRGGGRKVVDGRTVNMDRWVVHLEPKRTGSLIVPAFRIGQGRTRPVTLEVMDVPGAVTPDENDIFLEVDVSPRAPYVQSQVRYTERLFYAIPLQEGELTSDGIQGAMVERLGEDLSYVDARNNRLYRVTERHYVLFPQRSGQLSIPATRFEGRMATDLSDSQLGSFRRGRVLRLQSEPITLSVRPQPARFSGDTWLPSEDLVLTEVWSDDPPQFRVGEPVARTLIIEAMGLDGAQLPELAPPLPADFNRYMGQPEIDTAMDGEGIRGRREQQMVIQPTEAGRYTLPEVRLAWWDIRQDREQVAVLPAREIEVLAAAAPIVPLPDLNPRPVVAGEQAALPTRGFWFWASAGLLALWIATLFFWWRGSRPRKVAIPAPVAGNSAASESARRVLGRACQAHDPGAAARALLEWSAQQWPHDPPRTLAALAERLAHGAEAVRELDQTLYAPTAREWQGNALWQALRGGLRERPENRPAVRAPGLPELYPERA